MIPTQRLRSEKSGKESNALSVSVWSESTEKHKKGSNESRSRKREKSGNELSASNGRKERDMRMK